MVQNPVFDAFIFGCLKAGVGIPFGKEYWVYLTKAVYNFEDFCKWAAKLMLKSGSLTARAGYKLESKMLCAPSMVMTAIWLMSVHSLNKPWFKGDSSFESLGKSDSGEDMEEGG
mmetsp:Transcript_32451/g.79700  ORF Transcript_32451/g.79700 Transcript_32451/m.79700 type:complete len:114 (+) Transcript_32451:209-550(+)